MTTNHRKNQHESAQTRTARTATPELPGYSRRELKLDAGERRAFSFAALSVETLLDLLGGDSDLDAADELLRRGLERSVR
jgi:hypothetical protein